MVTKNKLWKQISQGLKENARLDKLTLEVMNRIRNLSNENHKNDVGHGAERDTQ